jgi:hypothetical protein
MRAPRHAISEGARRPSFWPSVAEASAHIVRSPVVADIGRAQPAKPAVRLGSPDGIGSRRFADGSR